MVPKYLSQKVTRGCGNEIKLWLRGASTLADVLVVVVVVVVVCMAWVHYRSQAGYSALNPGPGTGVYVGSAGECLLEEIFTCISPLIVS